MIRACRCLLSKTAAKIFLNSSSEAWQRQERFLLEMLRHNSAAVAVVFQQEAAFRTHDIPAFGGFRSETLMAYLFEKSVRAPLKTSPSSGEGPESTLIGVGCPCAIMTIAREAGDRNQALGTIDLFLPPFSSGDLMWHAPDTACHWDPGLPPAACETTSLHREFHSGDDPKDILLRVRRRVQVGSPEVVVASLWRTISDCRSLNAQKPLPQVYLGLPSWKSNPKVTPAAGRKMWNVQHSVPIDIIGPSLMQQMFNRVESRSVEQFIPENHPISQVLFALLLYRHQLHFQSTDGDTSDSHRCTWQYQIPCGQQYGLPRQWPFSSDNTLSHHVASPILHTSTVDNGQRDKRVTVCNGRILLSIAQDAKLIFDSIRWNKSPADAAALYQAALATCVGFVAAMRASVVTTRADMVHERHVLESMTSAIVSSSAWEPYDLSEGVYAYTPVVAGGDNTLYAHYTNYRSRCRPDDWLLVDAGVELNDLYVADVTRCWPVVAVPHSFPTSRGIAARKVCDEVIRVQRELLQWMNMELGKKSFVVRQELIDRSNALLLQALQRLRGCETDGELPSTLTKLMPLLATHSVGHFCGFDVHERSPPPRQKRQSWVPRIEPGCVHTVEPGLYLRPPSHAAVCEALSKMNLTSEEYTAVVPQELWGTGIRIEDMVLALPPDETLREEYLAACVEVSGCDKVEFVALQRSSIGVEGHKTAAWYPFHIVVLTAMIPKDIDAILTIMSPCNG